MTLDVTDIQKEVLAAEVRIRPHIVKTACEFSHELSELTGANCYFKLENLQTTGSFKLRGAASKVLSLSEDELQRGLVTASSGNHGGAFAHMVDKLGLNGTVFLPTNVADAKLKTIKRYHVNVEQIGTDSVEPEHAAVAHARETGKVYVSPYNDLKVIGGQGTIGIELAEQLEQVDAVIVPVGGGGLISGIGGYLKSVNPEVEIIGCQPINSPVMYESIKAGQIVEMESKPTLADGTAGGIEPDAITFEWCQNIVDDFILISEEEMKNALNWLIEKHYMLIEGASAMSIASVMQQPARFKGKNVALILCGKKIGLQTLKEVICG